MRLISSPVLIALIASACASSGTDGSTPSAIRDTLAVQVLGSCCPASDDSIRARLAEFERTPPSERSPELAVLTNRFSNGVEDRVRAAVTSPGEWQALWDRINARSGPVPPTPRVDFEREMLIVAGMGTRPTGGYAIFVDSVTSRAGRLQAWVREVSPGPSCGTTQALTSPIALIRLTRSAAPIEYRESTSTRSC